MNREQVINLFERKPRHAGHQLASHEAIQHSIGASVSEKAYNFCYPGSAEKYKACLGCNKPFKNFISFNQGYRSYCSPKCSNGSDEVKKHKVEGMLRKYGVENPMQSKEIKAKAQSTNLERYGAITPLRQDYIQEKIKNSLLIRYGVDHAFKLDSTKKTSQLGKQKTYALNGWKSRLELIESTCEVSLEEPSRDYKGPYKSYNWKHSCGTIFQSAAFSGFILACPTCKVKFRSLGEEELASFIETLVSNVKKNDRETVRPYELDIYCPDLNLAIEYNGLYWHSDEWKQSNYHLKKLQACNSKSIKLIQIFEDEWLNNKEIVKSRLMSILQNSIKIHGRKCKIRSIQSYEASKFLIDNHLQGNCGSSVRLGLDYEGTLVALMTFGKPRFNKKHDWELLRYCTLIGTTITGGASKLFTEFRKTNSGSIISYADRRWSEGNLYLQLGMTEKSPSPPSYFYTKGGFRINRVSAQKHKLKDLLGDVFDSSLTEKENMKNAGYYRVYDCGNHVYFCVL